MVRVILISSVIPSTYSAGHMVLHRHLTNEPEIDLQILETGPQIRILQKLLRRLLCRLERLKLLRLYHDILAIWRGKWIDGELPAPEDTGVSSVVMTVAHGDAYHAAIRYAHLHQLPLVTIFHDWWPDIPPMHKPFRSMLESSFRKLYNESSLALCVSSGMKNKLGPHQNSKVLYPMPARHHGIDLHQKDKSQCSFRLLYSGNLDDYGPMLIDALELLKEDKNIRLEVRGASSMWPEVIRKEMTERGLLLPYAQREEFDAWLESADAFLVAQSFDEKHNRLMQTNFPSKLVEFAQFGKPLVVWGPSKASAPVWATESGQALVVDQENPECLKKALGKLCADSSEQERLAAAAKELAAGPFGPERIQSDFLRWLHEVAV